MKRVLIITYYWPPSGGAGVQRWLKFVKYLPDFGWDPVVITVDPKYATYPVLDSSLEQEISDKIRVIRTESKEWFSVYKKVSGDGKVPYAGFANEKKTVSFKQKLARFIRGNFFIPDPRRGWNKYAIEAARQVLKNETVDAIITSSPPHSTQLVGRKLKKEFSIPWIADLRDPWTDIYYYRQFYPTALAHKKNLRLERAVLEEASASITVSEALKTLFSKKTEAGDKTISVLTNGYDPDDFKDLPERSKKDILITYVGTIAEVYPLDGFIESFQKLSNEYANLKLRFIGTMSAEHNRILRKLPEDKLEMIPYVKHRAAIEYMSTSSILLLIIPEVKNNEGIVTGKVFEYMAVERPILMLGPKVSDVAYILEKTGAGKQVMASDSHAIYETLKSWIKELPEVSRSENFNRKMITEKLSGLLNSIVN